MFSKHSRQAAYILAYKSIPILSAQLTTLESLLRSLFCGNIQYKCSANKLLMGLHDISNLWFVIYCEFWVKTLSL